MSDENEPNLAQFESVSGYPREIPATVPADTEAFREWPDPTKDWPMVIYVLPNGDTTARRENTKEFGSTDLAMRSEMVLRVHPHREPGNSDGGSEFHVEVLKHRNAGLKGFLKSVDAQVELRRELDKD